MKRSKNVKGKMLIFLLFNLCWANAQNFFLYDSVKVNKDLQVGCYDQIHAKDNIAYYWFSYSNPVDTINFFTYHPNESTFHWYQISSPFKHDYEVVKSMAIEQDRLVILGQDLFFIYQKQNNIYKLINTEKVKSKRGITPDHVYFLDYQNLFLASTYDYSSKLKYYKRHPIYSDYTFYTYNIDRKKYIDDNNINIGRGVTMCYYPFQAMAFNSNYMAVSHITKPQITLYSKHLKKLEEISLPPFSTNTDSIFEKHLSDSILSVYRYSPKNTINIINDNKLYQYPLIKGVSFLNEDTLMCIVGNNFETFLTPEDYRDVYLYSISEKAIVDSFLVQFNNPNDPKTFFFGSGLIQFNKEMISYVNDELDEENEKMDYYLKIFKYKSAKNCNIDTLLFNQQKAKEELKKLKPYHYKDISDVTFNFKGQSPNTNILKDYRCILWIDHRYFCASCYNQYKKQKIIVVINDNFKTKKARFRQKQYMKSLFPKGKVLFLKKGCYFKDLNLDKIKLLQDM